jgi:surface antigen
MAKADWSCDECGEVLPADHFVKVTDREVAGTRGTTRVYKGTRGGLGIGGSSSTSYRHVSKKLCPQCAQARLEALRRARARTRMVWLAGLAIAAAIVFGIASQPKSPSAQVNLSAPSDEATAENNEVEIPGVLPAPDESASPATETAAEGANSAESETQSSDTPPTSGDERSGDRQPSSLSPGGDSQTVEAAISAATPAALESGETTTWHAGSQHGYILVSAAQERAGKSCRNASWTVITAHNQIQGPFKEWCKGSDGAWKER